MCYVLIEDQIGACPLSENWKEGGAHLGYLGGPWVSTLISLRRHLRMNLWVSHLIGSDDGIPPIRFRSDCTKQHDWSG